MDEKALDENALDEKVLDEKWAHGENRHLEKSHPDVSFTSLPKPDVSLVFKILQATPGQRAPLLSVSSQLLQLIRTNIYMCIVYII